MVQAYKLKYSFFHLNVHVFLPRTLICFLFFYLNLFKLFKLFKSLNVVKSLYNFIPIDCTCKRYNKRYNKMGERKREKGWIVFFLRNRMKRACFEIRATRSLFSKYEKNMKGDCDLERISSDETVIAGT